MDNAAIHYKTKTRIEYLDMKIKVIYNVPYCCHINPIEYCFSRLKKYLKTLTILDQNTLINIVSEYLEINSLEIIKSAIKYALRIWEILITN